MATAKRGELDDNTMTCVNNEDGECIDSDLLDKSACVSKFSRLYLDARVGRSLEDFDFSNLTLVQSKVIPLVLRGKDVLIKSRTGTGKTLAYVIPIAQKLLKINQMDCKSGAKLGMQFIGQSASSSVKALIMVPTRELCFQVYEVVKKILVYCHDIVTVFHVASSPSNDQNILVQSNLTLPDILIGTPVGITGYLNKVANPQAYNFTSLLMSPLKSNTNSASDKNISKFLERLVILVVDEADVILSFGFQEEMQRFIKIISHGTLRCSLQTVLCAATLNDDVTKMKSLLLKKPVIVKLMEDPNKTHLNRLKQYWYPTTEEEKWLVLYAMLKLDYVLMKCVIFTSTVNRAYSVKLFLDRFSIKSTVLSPTVPIKSRQVVLNGFNQSLIDILITTDETLRYQDEESVSEKTKKSQKDENTARTSKRRKGQDKLECKDEKMPIQRFLVDEEDTLSSSYTTRDTHFDSSRGLDLIGVKTIINLDLPSSKKCYIHRVGRTARGGATGTAVTFSGSQEELATLLSGSDEEDALFTMPNIKKFDLSMQSVTQFKYRVNDVIKGVTKKSVRDYRKREYQFLQLLCGKIEERLDENDKYLDTLRKACTTSHDTRKRQYSHLQHLPSYLLSSLRVNK